MVDSAWVCTGGAGNAGIVAPEGASAGAGVVVIPAGVVFAAAAESSSAAGAAAPVSGALSGVAAGAVVSAVAGANSSSALGGQLKRHTPSPLVPALTPRSAPVPVPDEETEGAKVVVDGVEDGGEDEDDLLLDEVEKVDVLELVDAIELLDDVELPVAAELVDDDLKLLDELVPLEGMILVEL